MKTVFVTGLKGSGKTTVSNLLKEILNEKYNRDCNLITLAKPLKEMVFKLCKLFDVEIDSIDDLENPLTKEKYRHYMQYIGTEICQDIFSKECWCKLSKINDKSINVVTDLRFEHEFKYFHNLSNKSIVINVKRSVVKNNYSQQSQNHLSEMFNINCLTNYSNVYLINVANDDSIDVLRDLIEDIVISIKDL